jgi:hypothetical protein
LHDAWQDSCASWLQSATVAGATSLLQHLSGALLTDAAATPLSCAWLASSGRQNVIHSNFIPGVKNLTLLHADFRIASTCSDASSIDDSSSRHSALAVVHGCRHRESTAVDVYVEVVRCLASMSEKCQGLLLM